MLRKLGIRQFFIPNVVPHPFGLVNQPLVRELTQTASRLSQRQDQANSNVRRILGNKRQDRLYIAVIRADDNLLAKPLENIAINLQCEIYIGLFFFNHPNG